MRRRINWRDGYTMIQLRQCCRKGPLTLEDLKRETARAMKQLVRNMDLRVSVPVEEPIVFNGISLKK